ncbi:MAG: HU family DNA-binding protein [Clostridiales bacterium]|nr:HU family DNA-binding protein [Clostridiales bacterium]MDY2834719.1 HU family DNA-binding protein [Candidatus Aphodomonas sp.]
MNKSELCAAIAAKTGLTKKDAEKFTGAFVETVIESMKKGERVQVVGFGTFEVRERPARNARNPRTGETIAIEASKAPVFKAGKTLRESLN